MSSFNQYVSHFLSQRGLWVLRVRCGIGTKSSALVLSVADMTGEVGGSMKNGRPAVGGPAREGSLPWAAAAAQAAWAAAASTTTAEATHHGARLCHDGRSAAARILRGSAVRRPPPRATFASRGSRPALEPAGGGRTVPPSPPVRSLFSFYLFLCHTSVLGLKSFSPFRHLAQEICPSPHPQCQS